MMMIARGTPQTTVVEVLNLMLTNLRNLISNQLQVPLQVPLTQYLVHQHPANLIPYLIQAQLYSILHLALVF